jgi:hypothetical protein
LVVVGKEEESNWDGNQPGEADEQLETEVSGVWRAEDESITNTGEARHDKQEDQGSECLSPPYCLASRPSFASS